MGFDLIFGEYLVEFSIHCVVKGIDNVWLTLYTQLHEVLAHLTDRDSYPQALFQFQPSKFAGASLAIPQHSRLTRRQQGVIANLAQGAFRVLDLLVPSLNTKTWPAT